MKMFYSQTGSRWLYMTRSGVLFELTGMLFLDNKARWVMDKPRMILICLFCFCNFYLIFWIKLFLSMSSKNNILIEHGYTVSFCWELSPDCIWFNMLLFLLSRWQYLRWWRHIRWRHKSLQTRFIISDPFWKHLRSRAVQSRLNSASHF